MTTTTKQPLSGLRVIDMTTNLAGPFCGQMLGDFGADVIKLESPLSNGDMTRGIGPMQQPSVSWHFAHVNRNKRSVSLDIAQPEGREVFLKLLADTDVLIENTKTGSLEKWGVGYEQCLKEKFPSLIHCAISGFGRTGPYAKFPGYDAIGQAYGGLMSLNGDPDGDPVRCAYYIADASTGLHATIGVLMALQERNHSGLGQFVDLSLVDCTQVLQQQYVSHWLGGGDACIPTRVGNRYPAVAPADVFATQDGYINITILKDHQFVKLCSALECPELAEDSRYTTPQSRVENYQALTEQLRPMFQQQQAEPLAERLLSQGVPAAPVLTVPEAMQHKQAIARGMLIEKDGIKAQGSPIKLSRTPATISRLAPRFGEDNRAVLSSLGLTEKEIEALEKNRVITEGN
ncbi:MAG: CoA transferase [Gammaproteobacteria bacterium]|nr:MAG: CoA transferase [Gammaproteobacteria bacterium]